MKNNKSAVVTGASKGIGAATAKIFAEAGYDVAINYFSSEIEAEAVRKACESLGVKAVKIKADCSKESEIQTLAQEVEKNFGKLDVLVNNFGNAKETEFEKLAQEEMLDFVNRTLISAMVVTKNFVPKMMKSKSSVLNVASIYGLNHSASLNFPIYSASKAGLINFTQVMAKKYSPGIRFNAVAPGFTKTPHWDGADPERAKFLINSTLQKEWIMPEDIAESLLFLAESKHINAETIVIDAGWSKH